MNDMEINEKNEAAERKTDATGVNKSLDFVDLLRSEASNLSSRGNTFMSDKVLPQLQIEGLSGSGSAARSAGEASTEHKQKEPSTTKITSERL